ncbi:MAG: hypothetical protein DRN64_01690 [Thaumarchaeota archaeon]|nr:MAG: hypothetical protein DRN64_01690 [Nitrososphaerota archaeon]
MCPKEEKGVKLMRRHLQVFAVIMLIFLCTIFLLLPSGRAYAKTDLKPLEITGPMFSEVNETIRFKVTSNKSPIEGAIVLFAGYRNKTNRDGIAIFRIDFAGVFKAIAYKKGHKFNSTLVWVFPKGNERLSIRATKSVSEPQPYGVTISALKMAGFNYARVKAYYTHDEYGNVYPIVPLPHYPDAPILDESVKRVKELYPNKMVPRSGWIRVPLQIQLENLKWIISMARKWGFEIFLHAQLFYVDPDTGEARDPDPSRLLPGAKKTYLKQRKEIALELANFAEEMKIELLEPLTFSTLLRKEEFLLYKELLPEIRRIYSGKLAISDPGKELIDEIGLNGFDYMIILPGWAPRPLDIGLSEWENSLNDYLDYAELVAEKYGVKILLLYVGHIDWIMNSYTDEQKFEEKFMSKFNYSLERARIWFIKLLLDQTLKRRFIKGIDIHPIKFFHSEYFIFGRNVYEKYAHWSTKRMVTIVSKYLSHPWNREKEFTLKTLRHAKLAVESLATHSSNPELVNLMTSLLNSALKSYEIGDYKQAKAISQKILGFFIHVEHPLNITVDGNSHDWKYLDPVYFNPPSQRPFCFNLIFWYGKKVTEKVSDLKSVYALNDQENLYLMLEFYGRIPEWLPPIFIDTSGEWSHQDGKEFFVSFSGEGADIWEVSYEGMPATKGFVPQNEKSRKIGKAKVAIGDVVELQVPLKLLGNPKRVNIIIWYWEFTTPKGDIPLDLVNWNVSSPTSSISISTSEEVIRLGENVIVSGYIFPAHSNAKVTLIYENINGTKIIRKVTTSTFGEFKDIFTPTIAGKWTVQASWPGDSDHNGNKSNSVAFYVISPQTKTMTKTIVRTIAKTFTRNITVTEFHNLTVTTRKITKLAHMPIKDLTLFLSIVLVLAIVVFLLAKKRRFKNRNLESSITCKSFLFLNTVLSTQKECL